MRRFHAWGCCLLSCLFLGLVIRAQASDHFLTIGGGPNPDGNQLSLENNVLYLQRVLARLQLNKVKHQILFADGQNPQPDLQYEAERDPEDLRILLAEIIGPATGVRFDYRSSSLPLIHGTAEPATIDWTINELSEQLAEGDRLILYFTGHGGRPRGGATGTPPRGRRNMVEERSPPEEGRSTENIPAGEGQTQREERRSPPARPGRGPRREAFANNILHLWNDSDMSVVEWTQKLDALSSDVPVIAVMVQCYSGGFGNFIFKGGNPANGLAEHPRCGFFSTVPDRVAAGCTPNVNEAEYREYSSYFFEALSGENRMRQAVSRPDYDQDGQTSFLEAHAYTVLTAETIDIPVRTSDIYLRQVSSTTGREGLLTANSPITTLLENAHPVERAVIEGLSQQFKLTGADRAREVDEGLRRKREEKQRVDSRIQRHRETIATIRKEIGKAIKLRWPELAHPWHPESPRILSEQGDNVRRVIVEHSRYRELKDIQERIENLSSESDAHELQMVKLERLKYWLETRALAENLVTSDTSDTSDNADNADNADRQAGFHRLVELESQYLTSKQQTVHREEKVNDSIICDGEEE